MTKSELLIEFSKIELMLDSVVDMADGQHFEASALLIKRLSVVVGEFKKKVNEAQEILVRKDVPLCPVVNKEEDLPITQAAPPAK